MATKEEQETLRLLVQHVSRAFYEPKYTIVMDMLARHPVLKDDDLAGRMGLQSKELNKLMAVLSGDCLVQVYRQNELKEGAQRSVGKQYYYVDYQHFCNVVKWRIAKMRSIIDSTLRNELDNKGYICPQCQKSFSPLEIDKVMDFARGAFICDICHAELVDNENAESVRGSQDRMQRFNKQMRFIREGLQKSEAMLLPAFDVALWVKNNPTDADKQKATQSGSGLKVAGSGPDRKEDDGIGVMMSLDKDESTRKMERDAEAAAKRQQNALPAWHLKSTISGDLTALGVIEHARAEVVDGLANSVGSSSNDDILRGLGVVGSARPDHHFVRVVEDVKPVINHESDYYDQYYASLAASSAASTQDTPSGLGASGSDDFGDFGDFGDDDEDRKPSVEYLDSLNDYRKRSRSREDEGVGKKVAKVGENGYAIGGGITEIGHKGSALGTVQVDAVMLEDALPEDDPIVHVNGTPIPFSKVTEEDQELMTPEEYTTYFEVFQTKS